MASEIERKFLVLNKEYQKLAEPVYFHQGYLSLDPERIVRARIAGDKGYITIKGITKGVSRVEFEYEIPVWDAKQMLNEICIKPTIEKHRYMIPYKDFIWEVDEFHGENEGLVFAEIELDAEDQIFKKPVWIGEEVTHLTQYYNSNLIKNPYCNWKK